MSSQINDCSFLYIYALLEVTVWNTHYSINSRIIL